EHEATEVLSQIGEDAAVVAPSGHAGAGAVQQQQRRAVTGLVIAQHSETRLEFSAAVLITHVGAHERTGCQDEARATAGLPLSETTEARCPILAGSHPV